MSASIQILHSSYCRINLFHLTNKKVHCQPGLLFRPTTDQGLYTVIFITELIILL